MNRSRLLASVSLIFICYACSSDPHPVAGTAGTGSPAQGTGVGDSATDSIPNAGDSPTSSGGGDSAIGSSTGTPDAFSPSSGGGNAADGSEENALLGDVGPTGVIDSGPDVASRDAASHSGFIHPGLLLLQPDLDKIRANVAAGTSPWSTAWAALKNADAGVTYQPTVSPTITDSYALQNQGHAAWVLAIKWVASGDMTYATAAKRILDGWVDNVTVVQSTTLRAGIGAVQMANAAEIMGYAFNGAAGWPAPQVSKAKTWFKNVVWPNIGMANAQRSSNWGTSAMAGCMATAIFADDQVKFDYTVAAFKNGFTDAPDGCSGVTQYICDATGQATEAGRDQGHAQGGVGHLVEVAMMAWNQGTYLVSYANGRLVAGMEYLAKYNLNNDVPYDPNFPDPCNVHPSWQTISAIGRGSFSPIYEMANKLFTLAGAAAPYTIQVIASPGYQPEGTNSDHCGLGTLTMR